MRVSVKKNYKIYGSNGFHFIYRINFEKRKRLWLTQPPPSYPGSAAYIRATRSDLIATQLKRNTNPVQNFSLFLHTSYSTYTIPIR